MSNVLLFPTEFKGFRRARRPKCMHIGVVMPKGRIDYRFHGPLPTKRSASDQRAHDIVMSVWEAMDRLTSKGDAA